MDHQKNHIPVLLEEVITYLAPAKGETLLDVTAGYGGHANSILQKTDQYQNSVLIDRDNRAIEHLNKKFGGKVELIHKDFAKATHELNDSGRKFNIILADLGVSSQHLDNASRGFSFRLEGPLDMRMDESQSLSAYDVVNSTSEKALADLIYAYGDEPRSRRIARAIVTSRPIENTKQLANTIAKAYGQAGGLKTHPATRTFQAIRIAVNSELAQVSFALPLWLDMLEPGGRLGVISFHSLEDRIVKDIFNDRGGQGYDSDITIVTKKPIVCDKNELVFNPRARSAKLRVVVKK